MPNAWINHVKDYQSKNGCSYKEAMSRSKASYNGSSSSSCCAKEGGSLKGVMRKAKNTVKRVKKNTGQVTKAVEKNQKFANLILGDEMSGKLQKANAQVKEVNESIGGKFKLKRAVRKAKNTTKQVRKVAKAVAPILAVTNPEIGVPLEAGIMATGGGSSYKQLIAQHKKKKGGSFSVPKASGSGVKKGKHEFSNQYAMLSGNHPSMAPVKPKLK